MFYDLSNPHPFIEDINKILDDNGVWVLQLSYTPLMVKQLAFDNICHEHRYYYSLKTIQNLFAQHDLKIVDCELNDVNGGSFRIYVQKNKASITSFGTAPLRDVCPSNATLNELIVQRNNIVQSLNNIGTRTNQLGISITGVSNFLAIGCVSCFVIS